MTDIYAHRNNYFFNVCALKTKHIERFCACWYLENLGIWLPFKHISDHVSSQHSVWMIVGRPRNDCFFRKCISFNAFDVCWNLHLFE